MIKPDKLSESRGGIVIPVTAKNNSSTGMVMDASIDCTEVKKGQTVVYRKSAASIYVYEGIEYHMIKEEDVLAKIVDK